MHGLDGDSYGTWLSGSSSKDFWPDWLEQDIPNLAVWSLGYEATSTWWKKGAALALPDRAASILPRLVNEPDLRAGDVYFVVHSLGGLVVESVLRLAETQAPHSAEIAHCVRRVRKIAFIGTPHGGSDQASLVNRLGLLLWPRATTAGLSRNDPHLRDLNTWFRSFTDRNGIDVIVMRETLRVSFAGIPGLGGIVVKADSADPGLSPATSVIPIVADHFGIVAPRNREADVYKNLLTFLQKPSSGKHADTLVADQIAEVGGVVERRLDGLATQIDESRIEILAAIQGQLARPPRENSVVTAELERRLSILRKSRFAADYDAPGEARRLAAQLANAAELDSASATTKRIAFAWCARVLAAVDLNVAEQCLDEAQAIGAGEENVIAGAFIAAFRSGSAAGLAMLAGSSTPQTNTACFLIAANKKEPAEAVKWLNDAGLSVADLDSDGRFGLIQRRIAAGDIEQALTDVAALTEADFEATPLLLHSTAISHLAAAIHPELRAGVLEHLPIRLDEFPLNATPEAVEHRKKARAFYDRSATALMGLGQVRAANMSADYALWLALRDTDSHVAARRLLETSMSDPEHRLRRLPIALIFGVKLDKNAVELELEREAARSGGKSPDLAVARFAMARSQSDAAEVAVYIDRYRDQLTDYFNPTWIQAIEVEVLARSRQMDRARAVLSEIEKQDVPAATLESLKRVVAEEAGSDPVESSEKLYLQNRRFPDLLTLFDTLRSHKSWAKLAIYGKELFEQTETPSQGFVYVEALYRSGRYSEVLDVASGYPMLAAQSPFKHIQAWTHYRLGDLVAAKRLLGEIRAESDPESARTLESNIAIASGDWNALNVFVETQWARRDELSASELLRAGSLAQHIDSARDRDLITEAARKADGDARILIACYSAAIAAGWENTEEIQGWFVTAEANSGEDGPVQRFDFRQIVDMAPNWDRRESDAWAQALKGDLPMYAVAFLMNRSPLEMFTITALANLDQADPRKRGVVFAYSGTRPLVQVTAKCAAFDVSAVLSFALVGQLSNVFAHFESIRLSHRTMGWLLEQRRGARFHQPSRIKDAEEIRRLIDSGSLVPFEPTDRPNVQLEIEVGEDLASMLVAATAAGPQSQTLVVRPFPVHKPGSWMEELSDISGYETLVVSCASVVAALKRLGHLTEAEEARANKYLSVREGEWPHKAVSISQGAELYLDDVAVSYLRHLGLLSKLKPAGFKAFISKREVSLIDALLDRRAYSTALDKIIEDIREAVLDGVRSGHVRFGLDANDVADNDTSEPTEQPTMGLFGVSDADAFVIDDRFFNQHGSIEVPAGRRPVLTSLDVFEALRAKGTISEATFGEILTRLRRGGFLLMPILPTELEAAISAARVVDGVLKETAELKAIREGQLKARMIDVLQLPKESQWIDGNLRVIIGVLRRQWRADLSDDVSRARSEWLLPCLDQRGWTHRSPPDGPQAQERRAAQVLLVSQLPGAEKSMRERYEAWFEEVVLEPLKDREPKVYERVLRIARSAVEAMANLEPPDLDYCEDDE
ncbi:hypothetical protein V5F59_04465 [Xanthobacter autotrophicus DSM 431]|uniref:HTH domain-containing protein n=1 Tax=Xanthobacter nonsaccharivorans TaxID=3119912 RepID=UPI00372CD672